MRRCAFCRASSYVKGSMSKFRRQRSAVQTPCAARHASARLLAPVRACLLACLLACVLAYILACLLACLLACVLACLRACLHAGALADDPPRAARVRVTFPKAMRRSRDGLPRGAFEARIRTANIVRFYDIRKCIYNTMRSSFAHFCFADMLEIILHFFLHDCACLYIPVRDCSLREGSRV